VAYELKGSSQFFVGAADLTLADGWEYQNILSSRHLSSTTDAATWSQYIVTAFKKAYDKFNVESTIMAADMSRIANVSESVASLSQTLVAALQPESSLSPETYSAVAASLAASRVYNFTEVDLFDFCDELQSRSTDSTIQADARAVMSSLAGGAESLITSSWADTRYAETTDGQRGLSAYFARTANPDYFYNRLYQSLDFAIDGPGQDWLDFWMAYLAIKYPSSSAAGMAASSVGTRGCRPGAAPLDGEFAAVYLAIGSSAGLGADAAGMTSVHAVPARVQTDGAGPGAGTEVRRPAVESWQSDASVVACVLPGNASRARLNAHRDALFQTLGAEDDQVGVTPWTDRNAWRLPFQDLVTPWLDGE
jgi:hypothetical protein